MTYRSRAARIRRGVLSLALLGLTGALGAVPANASWPGLNGWTSFSSNRFGTAASGDVFAMPPLGDPELQLTTVRADDGQSAWSPDGRRIAFKSRRNGNNELYVMNWDGSEQTRLTSSFRISEGQPAWSPDGTRLLYRQTPDNPIVQNADIWQVDVNPAAPNARPVLERTGDERYPSYSPDGTRIVFRGDLDLVDHSGDEELFIMDADGTNVVQLTANTVFDSAPAFSPDGTQIAFESARDSGDALALDLYVMNADGSNVRRLTVDPAHDEGAIWSPDGKKLLFTSDRDGQQEIYGMNADGTGVRRLTDDPAREESPDWQPVPFDTTGHVACGDTGLERGAAMSVVSRGRACPAALRLAGRWARDASAGRPPARLRGFDCTATPHTFDLVLVACRQAAGPVPEDEPDDDAAGAREVAFVWRDPAAALPGA
jgi:Tol biopolymer transport system component